MEANRSTKSRRHLSFHNDRGNKQESQSCQLCGGKHSHMSTPSQWKSKGAHTLALSLQLQKHSFVVDRADMTSVGHVQITLMYLGGEKRQTGVSIAYIHVAEMHLYVAGLRELDLPSMQQDCNVKRVKSLIQRHSVNTTTTWYTIP